MQDAAGIRRTYDKREIKSRVRHMLPITLEEFTESGYNRGIFYDYGKLAVRAERTRRKVQGHDGCLHAIDEDHFSVREAKGWGCPAYCRTGGCEFLCCNAIALPASNRLFLQQHAYADSPPLCRRQFPHNLLACEEIDHNIYRVFGATQQR